MVIMVRMMGVGVEGVIMLDGVKKKKVRCF